MIDEKVSGTEPKISHVALALDTYNMIGGS